MSTTESNRIIKASPLCLRSGVMPALAIALLAGTVHAQDSGGFGLLAALKSQAKAASAEPVDDPYPSEMYMDDGYEDIESGEPSSDDAGDLSDLDGAVEVNSYDLVDLHVNNEDLGNILQLLSIQSQRNIISSPSVQATVTADLYGVTFYEALDAILHVNGYGYIEKDNFIYVYTAEELAEFEAMSRRPVTRIINLDYLNATDAAEFAKMLLSESGTITSNAATEDFTLMEGVPNGADTYANTATIVVHDFEENVEEIQALIEELDTKPAQILIEATILQTTLNEANAFGMDFALIQNLDFSDFVGTGGPLSVVDGLISGKGETVDGTAVGVPNGHGTGLQSTPGNTAGAGTLKAGFVNGDVGVFMRVLDEITDVTVVSNPKLLTLNRQPARVLVGTRVGYLNSTTTDTSTTQSVEFLDVGTELAVRPFVSKNGLIRLELRPQVSNFTLREVADGAGNNVTIPDEDTTEMNTNVMVRDGQTVVLGGLFTEATTASRSQVPVLGDIPLVGAAFKGHDDATRRTEIIFLITPSIINDTVLAEIGDMGNQYLEHARFGARAGLLPWSRERRVGQLLIDARQLADDGAIQEALAKVDRALRLMPMSPDARALRSELTGKVRRMPSRSLIEGAMHNELHYGGRSASVGVPNTVNPYISGYLQRSSEDAFDAMTGTGGVSEPLTPGVSEVPYETDGADVSPVDAWESYAEVPAGPVSGVDESTQGDPMPQIDPSPLMDEATVAGDELFAPGGFGVFVPEQDQGVSEIPVSSFDQMKAVVTGEQTSVAEAPAPAEQSADEPSFENGYGAEDMAESVVSVGDGFSGQLIIPLPSGGALRLDWPLGFDYVVGDGEESEAVFTEVPTEGDDFSDFDD